MSPIQDRGCPAWCTRTGDHATHISAAAWVDDDNVAVSIFEYRSETRVQILDLHLDSDDGSVHLSPSDARELGQLLARRDLALGQALIDAAGLAEGGA